MADFVLDLTHDGIRLTHVGGDAPEVLGEVPLDDDDLAEKMHALRAAAGGRAAGPVRIEIVIPRSEILYTTVKDPDHGGPVTAADIRAGLEGLTPCPADELRFDWRMERDGIVVAAIDINTLDEAESFAATYGFEPVRFTARPKPEEFPDVPDFGIAEFVRHSPEEANATVSFSTSRSAKKEDASDTADTPSEEPVAETAPFPDAPETPVTTETEQTAETVARRIVRPTPPPTLSARAPDAPRIAADRRVARPAPPPAAAKPVDWRSTAITSAAALGVVAILIWTALTLVTPEEEMIVLLPPDTPAAPAPGPGAMAAFEALDAPPGVTTLPAPRLAAVEGPAPTAMSERRTAALGTAVPPADVPVVDPFEPLRSADMWQTPPPTPLEPVGDTLDQLYLAAIDPAIPLDDAIALGAATPDWIAPSPPASPPEPGQSFDLDDRGLVRATPDGSDTPEGVTVTAGAPPLTPPPRPTTAIIAVNEETALALSGKVPRARPADLTERRERAQFGGRTLSELAGLRPNPRPPSAQDTTVANASLAASAQAVQASLVPQDRPDGFGDRVAQAQARAAAAAASAAVAALAEESAPAASAASTARAPQTETAAAPAPQAPARSSAPSIPTSASVARQATIPSAINLRRVNLIGVYGSASDRRALVRLPSGRYMKVQVGDRVDGGRVRAIGDGELVYVKGGRDLVLTVPSG